MATTLSRAAPPMRRDSETLTPSESARSSESEKVDDGPTVALTAADPEAAAGTATQTSPEDPPSPPSTVLSGPKLILVIFAMLLSMLLVNLDRFIIATAIPAITSQFQALDDAPWLANAYLITQGGCALTIGQFASIFPTKWVYLISIAIFEVGSVLCGAAPNMNVLIFGRAVAGLGSAGVLVSVVAVIAQVSRLDQRTMIFGFFSAVNAIGSILGPLLGGIFTDHVSWRWVFYINLPFAVPTVAGVLLFLEAVQKDPTRTRRGTLLAVLGIDWLGSALFFASTTCILIPLQWGGIDRAWSDHLVIVLFTVGGFLFICFLGWELWVGEKGILPLRFLRHRSAVGSCISGFTVYAIVSIGTYYLPLYYQSALQNNAMKAGVQVLPFMLVSVVGTVVSTVGINRKGRPLPFLIAGPVISTIFAGLLFRELSRREHPSLAALGVYQAFFGFGAGMAMQLCLVAMQAEFKANPKDVPKASALAMANQLLGGTLGVSIGGAIVLNKLQTGVREYAPGLSDDLVKQVARSVSAIHDVPPEYLAGVIRAYSDALGYIFVICIPAGAIGALGAFLIKNYDLSKKPEEQAEAPPIVAAAPSDAAASDTTAHSDSHPDHDPDMQQALPPVSISQLASEPTPYHSRHPTAS